MPDSTPETQRPDAIFRTLIRGTIEDVWHEITRTDSPIPAFFNTRMDANRIAPGSKFAMRSGNGKWTGVVGEILEVDAPTRFAHTFKFTNFEDDACRVVYDLKTVGDSVEFTLSLYELPEGTKTAKQMTRGGTLIVNTLKSVIETGRPAFGTRMLFLLFKIMAPLSPKKCRSEFWPVD